MSGTTGSTYCATHPVSTRMIKRTISTVEDLLQPETCDVLYWDPDDVIDATFWKHVDMIVSMLAPDGCSCRFED